MEIIYTTLTAARKIKEAAKIIQRTEGIPKGAALDRAAQNAGYKNYHHVNISLRATENQRHPFASAWMAIEKSNSTPTQANFFGMHDRLHTLLVGDGSDNQIEVETEFMRELAARPELVPAVINWLGSFLAMPNERGFLTLVFVQQLYEKQYPIANLVTNVAQIETQIKNAAGVQVLLSNTAMLAFPKEPSFTAMVGLLGTQLSYVMERLGTGAAPMQHVSPANNVLEVPGAIYVIPGWAHVPSGDFAGAVERLMKPVPDGSVVEFAGNGKRFSERIQRLGLGESLFSAWYPEHVLRTLSLLMEAKEAGGTWGSAALDLIVDQPDSEGLHDITVQLNDGGRQFAKKMPPVACPVYLFLALDSVYKHMAARVGYLFTG